MEKYYRTCRYSRKNKQNRHRGQKMNHRYHGCSTNTVKKARRKKSTHNRRVLKDEVNKVYTKHPDFFYGEQEAWVDFDCECQGWDEDGNLICEGSFERMIIPNPRPVSCLYKSTARKHYDYRGVFKPKGQPLPQSRRRRPLETRARHCMA
jgi:hypothetical protein